MAIHNLSDQFAAAQSVIDLGRRRAVAQAAHLEVRDVLRTDAALRASGLDDVLIGSYARDTGIWPGKDVDIFGKLTNESITSIVPADAYGRFLDALSPRYAGRITEQPRSIKIAFGTGDRIVREQYLRARQASLSDAFEFSVDVVPAVRWDGRWGIPKRDHELWQRTAASDRWVRTDPEELNKLTVIRNGELVIAGQGVFVPTVKAVKQVRLAHLQNAEPGGLFFEFMLHEGFANDRVGGESWADATASALTFVATRLQATGGDPVCDPVLGGPCSPMPSTTELAAAATNFAGLASQANAALADDKCPAAAKWRVIFGGNGNGEEAVFPLPPGCRADGTVMVPAAAPNVLHGSDEARGFGVV